MKPASESTTVAELAMLVRMLVSALKQYDAAHPMAAKATRLLADRGLLGTGLRQEEDYVQLDVSTENEGGFIALTRLQHEAISAAEPRRRGRVVDSLLPQTVARSADYLARRLDAADMVPLSGGGLRMGRSAQLIAVDGGPVIALDGGPGRGLVGPLWQFEPAMRAALPRLSAALGTTNGWALLSFLESAHGALGGRTPRQAIEQGETDLVIQVTAD